jgi:SPP1 gp7 family putative phage head morphogenesis protein
MTPKPTVTLPLRIELEYMMDQRRIFRTLRWYTVAAISKFTTTDQRQDSPGLEAFLRMSTPEILNERKLRRRLRQLAGSLSTEKLRELRALLGRRVTAPSPGLIDAWVDDQVMAIQASVEQWLTTSTRKIVESRSRAVPAAVLADELAGMANELARRAEARASFRILALNSQIIQEVAQGAGSTGYRWITEQDGRVRPHHAALHGSIQRWDAPPTGGGTRAGEPGHAGSGYGCRCIAEPLPGQAIVPLQNFSS